MGISGKRARRSGRPLSAKVIGSAVAISAASLGMLPMLASATSISYTANSLGYDVSWPNCSAEPPSSPTVAFAIVGIGGGRPFTMSSCAGPEYNTAVNNLGAANVSLYFNTGYSGAYARNITAGCTNFVTGDTWPYSGTDPFVGLKGHQLSQAEQAWEMGCSEAQYAYANAPSKTTFWWADVETGNSWSANTTLNQFTIDGMSYAMNYLDGTSGGIYSDTSSWIKLTGSPSFSPTPPAATWAAQGTCGTASFTTTAPLVVQNTSFDSGLIDGDTAC